MAVSHAQERIATEVSSWSEVVSAPHRFGGVEFRVGKRELGHIHGDYQADIAFPMETRNRLVAQGKAEPHHVLPKSGWITFRFHTDSDVESAIELFKLSYDIAIDKSKP